MPTVLRIDGHRFFFYSNEGKEPPHVHVQTAEKYGNLWLAPLRGAYMDGYTSKEIQRISEIVKEHEKMLIEAWNEHFTRR